MYLPKFEFNLIHVFWFASLEFKICDYLLRQKLKLENLEANFKHSWELVGHFYKMNYETEYDKLQTCMRIHEYFLSASVKKGS